MMGADRIEIEGPVDTDINVLKHMCCTLEIIAFRARIFAPNTNTTQRIRDRSPPGWPA